MAPVAAGANAAVQSHTGSGKTLAYLLPLLTAQIARGLPALPAKRRATHPALVVVAPSQELGMQILAAAREVLGPGGRSAAQQCIGGANPRRQVQALREHRPVLVVGTPGRLAALVRDGTLHTRG